MADPIEELRKDITHLKGVLIERERRMTRIEQSVKAINVQELSRQVKEISITLVGENGNDGLKGSVERLMILVDGDDKYGVTGICDQIESLKKDVVEIVEQRNQIKWTITGVLAVTALGNADGIWNLAKMLFGIK